MTVDTVLSVLHTPLVGSINGMHLLTMAAGALIPVLFALILPRRNTIGYGMNINKFLGLALLQRRIFGGANIPGNILEAIVHAIQTTFQDVSFGVYIDSRKDLSDEERKKKIEEYLQGPAKN